MPKKTHFTANQKAQIVLEMLREDKSVAQIASESGIHPNQLHRWKKQALENFPQLFEDDRKGEKAREAEHERQLNQLYAEIGRLSAQLSWLKKKNLASTLGRKARLNMLEPGHPQVPLKAQAELLEVSYSSLYYQPVPPSPREVAIKHRIDRIYTDHPFYGSRRITVVLRREIPVSRPTVQRCMREMGISGIAPGPNTSQPAPQHPIYPYLLRHVTASYPNHVWGIDITYIPLKAGWLYLVAVLDWFSRFIVSWQLSQTLELDFVLAAVDEALWQATPHIWNSDQGSHFTSPQYLDRLLASQVQISMNGRGRARDNIFTERLWRTIKYEEVYLHEYASPKEAYRSLSQYITFYNYERPHQALEYQTPRTPVVHSDGSSLSRPTYQVQTLTNQYTLN
ncbi:MAG: IS3 family transposase [Chloroflexota bacterium]